MARLILDEGDKRRAFKLNDGRLTIGSSDAATLTLTVDDVADVHAELRVEDGVVTLVPKPGVMPPTLLGRPVKQPTRLASNAEFKIGEALFRVESDAPATAPAAAAAAGAPARVGAQRSAQRPARGPRPGTVAATTREPRVQHQRRTVQRGLPSWAIIGIIVAVCGIGYFFGKGWLQDEASNSFDPTERYREAVIAYNSGAYKRTIDELDNVNLDLSSAELKKDVAELRKQAEAGIEKAKLAEYNVTGTKWLDTNLKRYQDNYLSGDKASRARARLFVKRCKDFKRKYPQHPDLEWVERYSSRYAKLADMDSPPEYADLEWEVTRLTAAKPRDYETVFKLIDSFSASATGGDATKASALRAEHIAGRDEYFLDRMQQARFHWEKKEYGQAVEWLVQVIIQIGDQAMEDQAADSFLKMVDDQGRPLSDRYLETYKKNRPEHFARMMKNDALRAAADAAGVK